MVSRPVKPRARRMALMVASVPELTKRTSSMDGMSSIDAPREPRLELGRGAEAQAVGGDSLHRFDDLRMRVAQDHRTPGADVVDEAAAVRRRRRRRPRAFLKKIGSPPTPRNARTGELTPPGMYLQASWIQAHRLLHCYDAPCAVRRGKLSRTSNPPPARCRPWPSRHAPS